MLQNLFSFFRNNRQYAYVLGFLIVVLVIYVFDLNRLTNVPTAPSPYTIKQSKLDLVSATPPSRQASTFDPYEAVWMEFTEPVDASTLRYSISPTLEFNIVHQEDDPKLIKFVPRGTGWIPRAEYTLKITALRTIEGDSLTKDITYIYLNEPPSLEGVEFPY